MKPKTRFALAGGTALAITLVALASNHREAAITALDHKADITDLFAFVSYDADQAPNAPPGKLTLVLCVDPLLEPANGPTHFPFDPGIRYEIYIDNDQDAVADKVFQFQFTTEYQLPDVYTGLAGVGPNGAVDPDTGQLVVPPRITTFDNPGLNLRQTYSARMVDWVSGLTMELTLPGDAPKYAVPCNAGERTMDYDALVAQATYTLDSGISLFAGTVDDPFFIDLGATFDTANWGVRHRTPTHTR